MKSIDLYAAAAIGARYEDDTSKYEMWIEKLKELQYTKEDAENAIRRLARQAQKVGYEHCLPDLRLLVRQHVA